VPDRLSPLDVSFLYLEEPTTAMHVGSVMIFAGGARRLSFEHLLRHVAARIAFVPRYRQRVRWVPGRLANPVWVDDEDFDVNYHVRRSALPRPGTRTQLEELVARLQARRLDRERPLWELIVVEGLQDGRFAVITKVHQALVDGVNAVDLGQVVLDDSPERSDPPAQTWHPAREPSLVELVAGAVSDSVLRPQQVVDTLRAGFGDVRQTAGKALEALGGLASAARTAARSTPRSPLNREITEYRRFLMVSTDLEDYRRIRNHTLASAQRRRRRPAAAVPDQAALAGGRPAGVPDPVAVGPAGFVTTVNDVVLATLAGALRAWLMARGEAVPSTGVVRALVPISVRVADPAEAGAIGSRVASLLVDLPTGEPSPIMRLHQVAFQTKAHREAGQGVDAPALAGIAGFAPPTIHSLGARVASGLSRRLFNLIVTNVPGPQQPLYRDGARMLSTFPVVPLAKGQALSVGLTSYDGGVYYGLNGDRDAMADLEVLGNCIVESLAEMRETIR
jgi:diacylglycerol O-acyltransferase / wax synthase